MQRDNNQPANTLQPNDDTAAPGLGAAGRTHRPWSKPASPWVMRMSWEKLLFAHWPINPESLRRLIPSGLELETFDANAWLGLVPFYMNRVRPRCLPGIPGSTAFPELNLRTYVTRNGKPGVWFFSLDAASRLAVAAGRLGFHLNYQNATMRCELNQNNWIEYESKRNAATKRGSVWKPTHNTIVNEPNPAQFTAQYRPIGQPFASKVGTLEHWLTERYCLYAANQQGRLFRGEIDHAPWPLRRAEANIPVNTITDTLNIKTEGQPHLLYADRIDVIAWLAKPA